MIIIQIFKMDNNKIIIDLEKEDVQQDLEKAIYMLHFLEEGFSKEEIKEVCFTLKHIVNNLKERSGNM